MRARPGTRRTGPAQRGVAAVEFALISILLFSLMLGAAEVARVLWLWNAAAEATRFGARMAVVCDPGDSDIKARMRERLVDLADSNITLSYQPAGCSASTCTSVTVSLTGYTAASFIPLADFSPALPAFRTTLPREYMASAGNPACL